MATLQIRKKSNKTWLHIDSQLGQFILSKFYFTEDITKFQIVEQGQSKRRKYDIIDIFVFDDTAGGVQETFLTITALSIRLEQLFYPAFDYSGGIPSSTLDPTATHFKGNYDVITNQPTLVDGTGQNGDYYQVSVAGNINLGSGTINLLQKDWIHYNGIAGIWEKWINNNQSTSLVIAKTQLTYTSSTIFSIPQKSQILSVVIGELRHLSTPKYTYNPLLATNNFEITDPTFLADIEAGTAIEITTI